MARWRWNPVSEQTVPIYVETEAAHQNLAKDGFISRLALLDKTRERIEKEQELKAQTHQVASLSATIEQSRQKLAQITSSYRQQLQNERSDANGQRLRLEQESGKQAYRRGLLELKAPQDGIVKDLATHTPGTVVSPGTILLTLVPRNDPVKAEVWVTNEDAGWVEVNQPVKIKIAAFPFNKYGMVRRSRRNHQPRRGRTARHARARPQGHPRARHATLGIPHAGGAGFALPRTRRQAIPGFSRHARLR